MRRWWVVGLLLLAGCAPKPLEQMSYSESRALAGELHQRCAAQGAPMGSPQFDACMKQEVSAEYYGRHAAGERADRARMALANGMSGMGQSMQRSAVANRPINCTSTRGYGSTVNTSCY